MRAQILKGSLRRSRFSFFLHHISLAFVRKKNYNNNDDDGDDDDDYDDDDVKHSEISFFIFISI
jgi:hypothetical protein